MFVALSYAKMNGVRAEKYAAMKAAGYRLVSYVSSRCSYLSQTPPGDNCFILEDNTVQPFVHHRQQRHAVERQPHRPRRGDRGSLLHHVARRRLGPRPVGTRSFLGVNATLRNSITIGEQTLIGAGAVIMKDTAPKSVYLPERAKLFQKTSDEIEL